MSSMINDTGEWFLSSGVTLSEHLHYHRNQQADGTTAPINHKRIINKCKIRTKVSTPLVGGGFIIIIIVPTFMLTPSFHQENTPPSSFHTGIQTFSCSHPGGIQPHRAHFIVPTYSSFSESFWKSYHKITELSYNLWIVSRRVRFILFHSHLQKQHHYCSLIFLHHTVHIKNTPTIFLNTHKYAQ